MATASELLSRPDLRVVLILVSAAAAVSASVTLLVAVITVAGLLLPVSETILVAPLRW